MNPSVHLVRELNSYELCFYSAAMQLNLILPLCGNVELNTVYRLCYSQSQIKSHVNVEHSHLSNIYVCICA